MTLLVLAWSSLLLKIRAIPKSDIFGFRSLSNKMLLAFKSLWIILNLESLWRYSRPLLIPSIMLKRFLQSSSIFLCESIEFEQKKQEKEWGLNLQGEWTWRRSSFGWNHQKTVSSEVPQQRILFNCLKIHYFCPQFKKKK